MIEMTPYHPMHGFLPWAAARAAQNKSLTEMALSAMGLEESK